MIKPNAANFHISAFLTTTQQKRSKEQPGDTYPVSKQTPEQYAYGLIFATMERYQPPLCCSCGQRKSSGRKYGLKFCYRADYYDEIMRTHSWTSTPVGTGFAFLCSDCINATIEKLGKTAWLIHVPIMLILLIAPWFYSRELGAACSFIALVYFVVLAESSSSDRPCAEFAWKCIKKRAVSNGCPAKIYTSDGNALDLRGWHA
jgi:hypothetical protein